MTNKLILILTVLICCGGLPLKTYATTDERIGTYIYVNHWIYVRDPSDFYSIVDSQGFFGNSRGGGDRRGRGMSDPVEPDAGGEAESTSSDPSTCNPVNIGSGAKTKIEDDLSLGGTDDVNFKFSRIYNESGIQGVFGPRWGSTFDSKLSFKFTSGSNCTIIPGLNAGSCSGVPSPSLSQVQVIRGDGAGFKYVFNSTQNRWVSANALSSAYALWNAANSQWMFYDEDGSVLTYSSQGRLLSKVDQYGIGWTLTYTEPYMLQAATHTTGKALRFYWSNSRVTSVVDPSGQTYKYNYNTSGYLSSVTYPGSTAHTRSYLYEVGGKPYLLTGISVDGVRYSLYTYNSDDTVLTSGLGTTGYYQRDTFSYSNNPLRTTVTSVTGAISVYNFEVIGGTKKLTKIDRSGHGVSGRFTDDHL